MAKLFCWERAINPACARLQRSAEGLRAGKISLGLGLLTAGSNACCSSGARLLATAAWFRGTLGSFAHKFHGHQAGDEFLGPHTVEINGRTLNIGFGHNSKSILIVLDALAFGKNLHNCLLSFATTTSGHYLRGVSPSRPSREN